MSCHIVCCLAGGRVGVCAVAVCVVMTAAGASAQEADESSADTAAGDNTVKTVFSAHRSVDDPRFPSGFVTRVDLAGQSRRGRDLGDALETVSGVDVRRQSSLGRPAFATVRGGNARQLAVSLNGQRISAPAGMGFDVGSLSLAGIDTAEVFRGSAATVYGGGALSGALDLHPALPEAGAQGWEASARAGGGSLQTWGLGGHGAVAEDESYAVRLAAGWRQSAGDFGFVDPQGTTHERLNNAHRQLGIMGAGRIEVGVDHQLEPVVMYQRGSGGAAGPSEFQREFVGAHRTHDRLVGQLGWRGRGVVSGEWGVVDMHGLAGYQRRTTHYDNRHAFPGGSQVSDSTTLNSFEVDAHSSAFFRLGDLLHVSIEGRQAAYRGVHQDNGGQPVDSTIAAHRRTLAVGLSNELLLFDDHLSAVAGVRGEWTAGAGGRGWLPVIPSAGLVWRALSWLGLKANVARTFRAPNFDELYLDQVNLRGQADLEAERAITWDAGVRVGRQGGPIAVEMTYFRRALEQSIYFIARTAYLFEAANLGSGLSQGIEATATVHPGRRLELVGSYTLTEAGLEQTASDVQMPGQPVHQASMRAEVELGGLEWAGGMSSLRVFGEGKWRSRVFLDRFANLSNPPFWTADLGGAVEPIDDVEVTVEVRNLADNRRGADSLQRPLPGRTYYGSVAVQWGGID